jgi:hypothetical protein
LCTVREKLTKPPVTSAVTIETDISKTEILFHRRSGADSEDDDSRHTRIDPWNKMMIKMKITSSGLAFATNQLFEHNLPIANICLALTITPTIVEKSHHRSTQ